MVNTRTKNKCPEIQLCGHNRLAATTGVYYKLNILCKRCSLGQGSTPLSSYIKTLILIINTGTALLIPWYVNTFMA